jgi:hypothetical protein
MNPVSTQQILGTNIAHIGRLLFSFFLYTVLLLVVLDVVFAYFRLSPYSQVQRFCNLAREDGVGTYFSVIQTFIVGQTALALAFCARVEKASTMNSYAWLAVGSFFFLLSLDDGSLLHERIGSVISIVAANNLAEQNAFTRTVEAYPSYLWQLSIGPVYLLIGFAVVYFLLREATSYQIRLIVLTGVFCIGTAFVLDFIEGAEWLHSRVAETLGVTRYTVRHFSKVLEESLELLGVSHFLLAFWQMLAARIEKIQISFLSA